MGLDTVDTVDLVVSVEKHFGIRIPDTEAEKIETVQQLADSVFGILTYHGEQLFSKKEVEDIVLRIVSEISGIEVNEIQLHHRIVYDLGLD